MARGSVKPLDRERAGAQTDRAREAHGGPVEPDPRVGRLRSARLALGIGGRAARSISEERRNALADAWLGWWTSRLAVFLASMYGVLTLGFQRPGGALHRGTPFGHLGALLLGPAQRWDGGFYVQIAVYGYHRAVLQAFFPLFPIATAGANLVVGAPLLAAVIVSLAALAVALYLLDRLVTLELGREHARTAVLVLAFFPTSLFFSMAYPEALLLALTLGATYAARIGRWWLAGLLGALASATHDSGVLVLIPVALLYLYGPRGDRDEEDVPPGPRWRPRHRVRADFLSVLLVPLGLLAFLAWMGVEHGDLLRPLHLNETIWHRHFELLGGLTGIFGAVSHSLHTIASVRPSGLFATNDLAAREAGSNLVDFAIGALALTAMVGVFRRLPLAYGVYTAVSLVLLLSAPKPLEPLVSLPRYVLPLFPIPMVIALWLDRRGRTAVWLGCSGAALGALAMKFAVGGWVA
jgi:Mannosyltransferase (PIG-V)